MKFKQRKLLGKNKIVIVFVLIIHIVYPKSVRPLSTNNLSNGVNKHRVRCSLCDSLLKASTTHRYFLMGKSAHDNLDKDITYGECCQRYLNSTYELDKFHMICPKCCENLQQVYSLHKNAEELTEKLRHTWYKTKRLNRTRHSRFNLLRLNENISSSSSSPPLPTIATDDNITITVKEEVEMEQIPSDIKTPIAVSESILANTPYDLSNNQRIHKNSYSSKMSHPSIDTNHEITNGSNMQPHVNFIDIYFIKYFDYFILDSKTIPISIKNKKYQFTYAEKISSNVLSIVLTYTNISVNNFK
jgi:hypothetical protein